MKELAGPPANPIKWLAKLKDGRVIEVEAKLWYAARNLICKQGVQLGDIIEVIPAPAAPAPELLQPDDFEKAPMYTVFSGPAADTGIGDGWDIFAIDGGSVASDEVMKEAAHRGIIVALDDCGMMMQPQWDADVVDDDKNPELADDYKAACAYLNSGGRLVKLPDVPGSKYFRLYPVVHVRREHGNSTSTEAAVRGTREEV